MNSADHVAIIMDGNGRWAEQRGMPRWKGHEAGVQAVQRVSEEACLQRISILTLFAFSSENWRRPRKEVFILFDLFQHYLASETRTLLANNIRISAIGRRDRLPAAVCKALAAAEEATRECTRLHLRLALDYGSRHEIIEAARSLAADLGERKLQLEDITEESMSRRLSGETVPDPALIIRTAGEQRLSNFLLWQAAYAELYFCPKLWPDFEAGDLKEALAAFHGRTRKFGALAKAI